MAKAPVHPMTAMKGSADMKALMAHMRSKKKPMVAAKQAVDAAITTHTGHMASAAKPSAASEAKEMALLQKAKKNLKMPGDMEDAADVAAEPGGEPVNEKTVSIAFMNKRRKAAASKKG